MDLEMIACFIANLWELPYVVSPSRLQDAPSQILFCLSHQYYTNSTLCFGLAVCSGLNKVLPAVRRTKLWAVSGTGRLNQHLIFNCLMGSILIFRKRFHFPTCCMNRKLYYTGDPTRKLQLSPGFTKYSTMEINKSHLPSVGPFLLLDEQMGIIFRALCIRWGAVTLIHKAL